MKQLLSLFLFLLPCLAWAQYPSNGNQKITLGEQTTADGLIWRGVLADTGIITPLSDTSAYIILDTVNHRFYNYNRATNVWSVAGGGTAVTTFSGGSTGLTPSTATSGAVTLGGTLAVANGGTNASTFTEGSVVFAGASGTYTQDNSNLFFDNTNKKLGIGTTSPTFKLDINASTTALNVGNSRNSVLALATLGKTVTSGYGTVDNYLQIGAGENAIGSTRLIGFGYSITALANQPAYIGYIETANASNTKGALIFGTRDVETDTAPTERMRITSGGNVGIGTTSPTEKLDVTGTGKFIQAAAETAAIVATSSWSLLGNNPIITFGRLGLAVAGEIGYYDPNTRLYIGTTTSHSFAIRTNNSDRLIITNDGNVKIGTGTPQSGYRLHVVDSVYVGGNVSASAYTTRSDFNLKNDIFDLKYGLNDILKLQPVEYTYKTNGSKQLGFIAQDIGTILPEVVSFEESMSVNYQAIIPILTKAIQEQQALIKALEQRIINLENK